ncbi:UNVERIFIED_CONTAM: hypothetical protein RMT77_013931 [Armadillidium vulgare]
MSTETIQAFHFARLFLKCVSSQNSYPVNVEFKIKSQILQIEDKNIPEFYFNENKTIISFVNLHSQTKVSMGIDEVFWKILRILRKSKYKYRVYLDLGNHHIYAIKKNEDIEDIEFIVKREKWWKMILIKGPKRVKRGKSLKKLRQHSASSFLRGRNGKMKGKTFKKFWKKKKDYFKRLKNKNIVNCHLSN